MPSSPPQPILLTSLSTMPRPSALGPKPPRPPTPPTTFQWRRKATARYQQLQAHPPLSTPHLQGCKHNANPHGLARPSTSHVISDDEDSGDETAPPPRPATTPPALNTRSGPVPSLHETMLHFLATHHIGITAAKATQRRYPPDMLHAVLNDESGTWPTCARFARHRERHGHHCFHPAITVPQDRWKDVTYGRIVANFRPEKEDPYRIRLTVGGNRINYPGDCGTPTADMITVKILLNSVISTLKRKVHDHRY
eukprot:CCRYP_017146-RA/>CCRYP_017146-RA protein AED:0.52 eAED:0.39 QI:0/0/0/1/0/0/3/0/252